MTTTAVASSFERTRRVLRRHVDLLRVNSAMCCQPR
jgi:hypothetical protein